MMICDLAMGRLQLSLVILTVVVCKSDCSSYHIGFLGRKVWNATSSIGEIRFRPSTSTPVITSAFQTSACTSPASPSGATATDPKIVTFNAPDCVNFIPNGNEKAEKGLKIESPDILSLHVYQNDANGKPGDGYLVIPDEHLGNEYYVNTYCSLGGTCQFAVAGVLDGTSVKIVFPTNNGTICSGTATVDASKGTALPFMINEFDILHFESDQDLTGTHISSDKKVAVFVGSRDVPSRNNTIFTNMIEQIPPVSNWGTTFVVAPNHLNEQGDQIKIVTATDNTKIHILGFSTFRIPSKGSHVVRRMDWHLYGTIEASNPVLIMQIMLMNLYNNSTGEIGAPSMVLVPHIQQWLITQNDFFYCQYLPSLQTQPLTQITIISKTASYSSVPLDPYPPASAFLQSWTTISTTPYSVQVIQPQSGVFKTRGDIYAYGYCNGTAAVLLGANWQWKNTGCKETLPYPGDGKDNNCDGQIDEVNCTMDDLKLAFNSSQNPNGTTTFKRISVGGVAPPIKVSVQSCDVAVITLADNNTNSRSSFTILISKSEMVVQLCTPDCTVTQTVPNTVTDCLVYTDYYIGWERNLPNTRHTIRLGTGTTPNFDTTIGVQIDYVDMMISSLTGPASFNVDLPEKDCNKIISNEADNFGFEFLVPIVPPGTTDIFVTTNSSEADVTYIELNNPMAIPTSLNVLPYKTVKQIIINDVLKTLKITSTHEVSVYVIRKTGTGKAIGFSVFPTDVFGPSYHLYKATYENYEVCKVLPKWSNTETNIGIKNVLAPVTVQEYNTLGKKHLLEANKPLAVFCGIKDDTFVQIPPAESLGKQFYIPKIDFTAFKVQSVNMTIIATEDSTVVITKGDYDLLDSIDLTVESTAIFYTRSLDSNFTYNITSTYPVQVQLELNSSSGNTLIMIPPVSQYKKYHVYPQFPNPPMFRSSVTDTGSDVSPAPVLDNNPVTHPDPTFSLTLYTIDSTNNINIIYPSDVFYKVTNKGCYISTGTPGDHEDNDCDGLVDEEQCSTTNIRGEIDYDIDGALNEDCAVNTAGPSSAITLSLPTNTCSAVTPGTVAPDTTIPTQDEDLIVIDIEPGNQSNTQISFPNYITIPGTRIKLQNLTADGKLTVSTPLVVNATSGNQTVPEETCRTDCLCPCGWVEQKNYTKAQIEETVREIQEKLKVTKDELSAIVRTKISASDDRPAATAIGIVGGAFFIAVIGLVVLLDVTALFRDLQMMIGNLRQVFQP